MDQPVPEKFETDWRIATGRRQFLLIYDDSFANL